MIYNSMDCCFSITFGFSITMVREYQHDDTIPWIAAPKLTEIVEVENETWQGAKFGVC